MTKIGVLSVHFLHFFCYPWDHGGKGISLGMSELSQQELWRQFVAGLVVSRITNSSNVSLSAERPCPSLANSVQTYLPSESYMSP